MIYTVTALGWFLLVVEAIIAAPIVSLGFVIPSGEELGKVVPGLMLLVSIVLRPTLMVFGFILAARLFRAVVALVNFGMADTFKTIPTTGSLLAPVAAMCLYGGFIIALVNKSFALIYIVPDKVLRWIGGPTEQTDASAAHEAKQSMDKGAQVAKGMGESLAKGGSDSASKLNDKKGQEVASANNSAKSEAAQAGRHKELMGALKGKGGDAVSGGASGGAGPKPPVPPIPVK
jgi:hypothetical protein